MSRHSKLKELRKELIRIEEERRAALLPPSKKLTSTDFQNALHEYLRLKTHPHIDELFEKYPALLKNEGVLARLYERYPSSRMNDKEFWEMWSKQVFRKDFILNTVKRDDCFQGKYFPIPLEFGDKND